MFHVERWTVRPNISCFSVDPTQSGRNGTERPVASGRIETYEGALSRVVILNFLSPSAGWVAGATLAGLFCGLIADSRLVPAMAIAMTLAVLEGQRRCAWCLHEAPHRVRQQTRSLAFLLPPMAFSCAAILRADRMAWEVGCSLWAPHVLGWGLVELGAGWGGSAGLILTGCWILPALLALGWS